MTKFRFNIILLLAVSGFVAACTPNIINRSMEMESFSKEHTFQKKLLKAGKFTLTTYQKITDPQAPYVFYIEGDGYAFESYGVSDNPTPLHPKIIKLAAIDGRPNVVYIARPCQYTPVNLNPICSNTVYWTDKRMSKEVVDSVNDAINIINNGLPFSIIGFSGGGGVAVLIAAYNKHVRDIITVAGNVDTMAFHEAHISKQPILKGSLNPINYADKLGSIPQLHLSGSKDAIVPPIIAQKYVKASNSKCVVQKVFPDVEHWKGWEQIWPEVLNIKLSCDN